MLVIVGPSLLRLYSYDGDDEVWGLTVMWELSMTGVVTGVELTVWCRLQSHCRPHQLNISALITSERRGEVRPSDCWAQPHCQGTQLPQLWWDNNYYVINHHHSDHSDHSDHTTLTMFLLTVLCCCLLPWVAATSCPPGMLAVYRLSLATEWSEEKFPKQYPQWRPPAQWSKTVGQCSDISNYFLENNLCARYTPVLCSNSIVKCNQLGAIKRCLESVWTANITI